MGILKFIKTDSSNADFRFLVRQLDKELSVRDGDDHDFYNQFNKLDKIHHVIVVLEDGIPLACGAIKKYDISTMEIKRMYTNEAYRGKGIASKVLEALERWAAEMSYEKCMLETGIMQPEAIGLYKKCAYIQIENYGQYRGIENSLCFQKIIKPSDD